MGWIKSLEHRAQQWPLSAADDYWYDRSPSFGGGLASGVDITPDGARALTAVARAVALVSQTQGMLPAKVYRRTADGGKEPLRDNPAYELLRWQPNPWQTAFEWYEMQAGHIELRGNCFSRVERDGLGRPTALVPWHPDRVRIEVRGVRFLYTLTKGDGSTLTVPMEDMLHVKGPGNGVIGYSPIAMHAESLGVSFAAQSYGARFFGNDSRPGGVLVHPGQLNKAARDNIEQSWQQAHSGANQHSIALLEEGMEFKAIGVSPDEAQFLQTRNFQIDEVARIFGIPPHMLMQMDRSTFSNIEHQGQEFGTFSMQPRLTRWEQAIKRTLFPGEPDVFMEFLMDAVLRADTKTRADANQVRFQNGNLSANEWRAGENQNPIPADEGGDTYFVPLNMSPLSQAAAGLEEAPADEPPPDDAEEEPVDDGDDDAEDDRSLPLYLTRAGVRPSVAQLQKPQLRSATGRHRQMRAFRKLFRTQARRVLVREDRQVRRALAAASSKSNLIDRLAGLYEVFADQVTRELHPSLRAYAEVVYGIATGEVGGSEWGDIEDLFMRQYAETVGVRYAVSSEGQLEQLANDAEDLDEARAAVETRLAQWDERRPEKMAVRESVQANGAVSRLAYAAVGVSTVWLTFGDNCPLCDELDGRTAGVGQDFVDAGATVNAAGASPLTARNSVGHPQLHEGCDCMVVAGG